MTFPVGCRVRAILKVSNLMGVVLRIGEEATVIRRYPADAEKATIVDVELDAKDKYGQSQQLWDIAHPWNCFEEVE